MKNNIRKLTKTGRGSLYVILPRDIVASFGWRERQKLVVTKAKGCVVIRDWKKK